MWDKGRLELSIGIDPGWKNLGFAIVARSETPGKVKVIATKVFDPSMGSLIFVEALPKMSLSLVEKAGLCISNCEIKHLVIERYAAYNNVMTAESENIGMLIGGIRSKFFSACDGMEALDAKLYRAIDWKIKLVQLANKRFGYENPSDKLDKKFSMSMAIFLMEENYELRTDHEADAICLASIPFLEQQSESIERNCQGDRVERVGA